MKLIHLKTGTELKVGDQVKTVDGELVFLTYMQPPQSLSSTGRVFVKKINSVEEDFKEFFPSVLEAKWV